jgi:DNA-binding MarR family transcriptional regulator
MVSLWSLDDRIVKEIGEALSLESNTLTPILKRLETLGLITRTRDAENERQLRIRLTKKGHALRERAESIPVCVTAALGLSPLELVDLREKLRLVQERLRDSAEKQRSAQAPVPA